MNKTVSLIVNFIMVAILAGVVKPSPTIIKVLKDGIKLENPCQTDLLSSFVPSIPYGKPLIATKASNDVRDMCSYLKYSCCNATQLNGLAEHLKHSFKYLDYRSTIYHQLFSRVNEVAQETFDVFIDELTDEDKTCYSDIQKKRHEKKVKKHSKNHVIMDMLRKKEDRLNFNADIMKDNFKILKSLTIPYLKKIDEDQKARKAYYSGFICTMCSPSFYTNAELTDDGDPMLVVNRYFCVNRLKEKINFSNHLEVFKYLQYMLDIIYCARKNSLKTKDFHKESDRWEDNNLLVFDLEEIPSYLKVRNDCIKTEHSFQLNLDAKNNCRDMCQSTIGLFKIPVITMEKIIQCENELHNMFFSNDTVSASKRYERIISAYMEHRTPLVEMGVVEVSTENKILEKINILKTLPHSRIDWSKSKILISSRFGINVVDIPMSPKYYKFVSDLNILLALIFVFLIK